MNSNHFDENRNILISVDGQNDICTYALRDHLQQLQSLEVENH